VAVIVAFCDVLTAEAMAVKVALLLLAPTITEEGTVSAASLLDKLIVAPSLLAAELRVTVQTSVQQPVMVASLHETALTVMVGVDTTLAAVYV